MYFSLAFRIFSPSLLLDLAFKPKGRLIGTFMDFTVTSDSDEIFRISDEKYVGLTFVIFIIKVEILVPVSLNGNLNSRRIFPNSSTYYYSVLEHYFHYKLDLFIPFHIRLTHSFRCIWYVF
jgi:hypothetical protein